MIHILCMREIALVDCHFAAGCLDVSLSSGIGSVTLNEDQVSTGAGERNSNGGADSAGP